MSAAQTNCLISTLKHGPKGVVTWTPSNFDTCNSNSKDIVSHCRGDGARKGQNSAPEMMEVTLLDSSHN